MSKVLVISLDRFEKDKDGDPVETRLGKYEFIELPRIGEQISIFDADGTSYLKVESIMHFAKKCLASGNAEEEWRDEASVTIFATLNWKE